MKSLRSSRPAPAAAPDSSRIDRRGLVIGAGVAGAAAVAAGTLHRAAVDVLPVAAAKPATPDGEGYRLTAHVKRYYETTKA